LSPLYVFCQIIERSFAFINKKTIIRYILLIINLINKN